MSGSLWACHAYFCLNSSDMLILTFTFTQSFKAGGASVLNPIEKFCHPTFLILENACFS